MSDLGWTDALLLVMSIGGVIAIAHAYIKSRRDPFISNREIHRYRITPRFHVGRDVKHTGEEQ